MRLKLYHYWRSSSSWRVRLALAHKGVQCDWVAVDLLSGDQSLPEHLKRNPMGLVPVLETPQGLIGESTAILEWLEECYPTPALLPLDPWSRARVRQLTQVVNSGTQPLQNFGVMKHLSPHKPEQQVWSRHWIARGLGALERLAVDTAGSFCVGSQVSFADFCLVPQLYNARRFSLDLSLYPTLLRVEANVKALPCYGQSEPDRFGP